DWFKKLLRDSQAALRDVETALARVALTAPKERIELLRLAFMLAKASGHLDEGRRILLADALPPPATELIPSARLRVRFFAMNFYNQLEKDAGARREANQRFIKDVGARAEEARAAAYSIRMARQTRRKPAPAKANLKLAFSNLATGIRPFLA